LARRKRGRSKLTQCDGHASTNRGGGIRRKTDELRELSLVTYKPTKPTLRPRTHGREHGWLVQGHARNPLANHRIAISGWKADRMLPDFAGTTKRPQGAKPG